MTTRKAHLSSTLSFASRGKSLVMSKMMVSNLPWALALILLGCSKSETANQRAGEPAHAKAAAPVKIVGSGATFPAPLYNRWFKQFSANDDNITVDYQAVGSGQGIKSFIAGHTDFGASDAAMSDAEMSAAGDNVLLLPMTAGAIVLAYNLPGVDDLKLSRDVYSGMFLGEIKNWNDPEIAKINPDATLPDRRISVVHRSDGSGTTFVFTQHLTAINEHWKQRPGTGKSVEWPVGLGARGNDGVVAQVKQIPGAVGYVEYAFAELAKLPMANLENNAGRFVKPSINSATAALDNVELPTDFRAWVTDPGGENSYPIVTYTWILAKKDYDDSAKAAALKKVLHWSLTDGQALSAELKYVPLPESVASKVTKAVDSIR